MRLPDLEAWAVFACVAEQGSFARAADVLHLSKPTVSKAVSRLEASLGTALLNRTSRQLSLTETGRRVLEHAHRLVSEAEAAEAVAREGTLRPAGVLRVAAPMTFGIQHLSPLLPEFLRLYPDIDLTIDFNDSVVDLVAEGYDVALRVSALADSSLKARKLCTVRRVLVATPDWIRKSGGIAQPHDLAHHKGFVYTNLSAPGTVRLKHAHQPEYVLSQNARLRANNAEAFLPTLYAGLGYGLFPEFMVWDGLKNGSLVPLLPEWQASSIAVYLVTPPTLLRPIRLTVFLDYLTQNFVKAPWATRRD